MLSSYSSVDDNNEHTSANMNQRHVRFNPFNDPSSQSRNASGHLFDSIDEEQSKVIKGPPKTFLQLHEEYGQQVKTLGELWRGSFTDRPASAFELAYSSC